MLQSHMPVLPGTLCLKKKANPDVYIAYTKFYNIFGKLTDIAVYFSRNI
jgi:hypothetical protein